MSFKKVAAGCAVAAQCLMATLAILSPAQAATATSTASERARDNGVIHVGDLRDNGVIHVGDLRDNGVIHVGDLRDNGVIHVGDLRDNGVIHVGD
ncbi:MAG: hypothetical protein JOZ12_15980 [Sinobacteraceae bacterium]|nr:hypothetical protein [Nevskiaceae bacterium]MBV8854944.1 hypothetical protein [Nevskiaceae bacterium]MBV9912811.1 hypothetical protein [Nevskiaceae bacterium]